MQYRDEIQALAANAGLNQKKQTMLINGSTGLGKTAIGYLLAQQAVESGKNAIIALPYHALIHQSINKTFDMELAGLDPSVVVHYKSASTWASPTRAARFKIDVEYGETCEEVIERCQESHPLLSTSDICVRAKLCPDNEMSHYADYRDSIVHGRVIFCTHTALILNAWTQGRYLKLPNISRIIVDEADIVADMAKLLVNRDINNEDFDFLCASKRMIEPTPEAIDYYIKRCEAKMEQDEERALELLAILKMIRKNLMDPYCNILPYAGEWRVRFRKSAGILRRLSEDEGVKVNYMSGTLAMREEGFSKFATLIGAKEGDYETCFAVHKRNKSFGHLDFILASRLSDDEVETLRTNRENWEWKTDVPLTVECAQEAIKTGNTLILVPSTDNTINIAEKLPGAVFQKRGENAKHCIARYIERLKDNEPVILIGHGIWAGLDIESEGFAHIIIPRIPYSSIDEADLDEDFLSNQDRATRKMGQGQGRGVRHKDAKCTIWILDKRFPLSSGKMDKLGVDNRFVSAHIALKDSISSRFELAYNRAQIAYLQDGKLVIE